MRANRALPDVGTILRQLREKGQLSQEALAARAGLHRTYISQLERGVRQPTIVAATRILDALGVSWSEFGHLLEQSRGPVR